MAKMKAKLPQCNYTYPAADDYEEYCEGRLALPKRDGKIQPREKDGNNRRREDDECY
jgi:hypothetical protein